MNATIINLLVENIKRVSAVEIDSNGAPVVVLAGENEQGKSSVLDAIEMALGGKDKLPKVPVKRGKEKGRVIVDLGEIVVTRTFTADGGTNLVVQARDGSKLRSPQAVLDALVGKLTFDPMAFVEMGTRGPQGAREQAALLSDLVGLDLSDLVFKREQLFNERTLVNRDVSNSQGALSKLAPAHTDVPATPDDADPILKELEAANQRLADITTAARKIADAQAAEVRLKDKLAAIYEERDRIQKRLDELETAEELADAEVLAALSLRDRAEKAHEELSKTRPDIAAIQGRLVTLQDRNRKVAENQRRAEVVLQLSEHQRKAKELTEQIAAIDDEKANRLRQATFPIPGLGVDDDGVTWDGLPFEQASTAVKIRASIAIGAALNPKLRVLLVRSGNDLDDTRLALVAEEATARGLQIWIERIAGGGDQTTVTIEDGTVKAEPGGTW